MSNEVQKPKRGKVVNFFIHAWYPCDDSRLDNDLKIETNRNFEPFKSYIDAVDCFQRLVDTARKLLSLGKTNQFEVLELFRTNSHKKKVLICCWDFKSDMVVWSSKI